MGARERQDELAGLLRSRGVLTVSELASYLETSVRTIHRDIEALRSRGVPIEGEPGPGGGVRLDAGRCLPPVDLALDEIVGLSLALGLANHESSLLFGKPARRALDKMVASLPSERARDLRRLLRRVLIGQPASEAVRRGLRPVRAPTIELLEQAFHQRRALGYRYEDRHGARTTRRVEVHGLLLQPPAWYLLAFDLERQGRRMFRLDRISAPRLLDLEFAPRPLSEFADLVDEAAQARGLV